MHILYFPYTHLTDGTLETLSACFDKITLYQSSLRHTPEAIRIWAETGRLALRVPGSALAPQIEEGLKSFQALGALYGGKRGGITNFPRPGVPFQDENRPSKIQAELKRMIQEETIPVAGMGDLPDAIIQACLFLQFAQEFDAQQEALGRNLRACDTMEREMFDRLKGGDEELSPEAFSPSPAGSQGGMSRREHMLAQRLAAWACLFLTDWAGADKTAEALGGPVVLVTSDRLAFDEILAKAPGDTVFFDLAADRTGGGAPELSTTLGRLAGGEEAAPTASPGPAGQDAVRIHAALIPNQSPSAFLAPFAGVNLSDITGNSSHRRQQNTLICLVST